MLNLRPLQVKLTFNKKSLFRFFYWSVFGVVLVSSFILILSSYTDKIGIKVFNVNSGSMAPYIRPGSLVVTFAKDSYKTGDVITFVGMRGVQTYTHRIIELAPNAIGEVLYLTKGDANNARDPLPVPYKNVIGKVTLRLPFAGYLANFIKTPIGFISLVVFPLILIMFTELNNIKKELMKWRAEKLGYVDSIYMFSLITVTSYLIVSTTSAYLWDIESSKTNQLAAHSLDIELTSTESTFNPSEDILPGNLSQREFNVENIGDVSVDYAFSIEDIEGDFCVNSTTVKVYENDVNGVVLLDSTLGAGNLENIELGQLHTSQSAQLLVVLEWAEDLSSSYSNTSCGFDFEIKANMTNQDFGIGFWDKESMSNTIRAGDWVGQSDLAKWHFQPFGQVGDDGFTLYTYYYKITSVDSFSPKGSEGLLVQCYIDSEYTTLCPGVPAIVTIEHNGVRVYDETSNSWYCQGQACSPTKIDGLDKNHVYRVEYMWEEGHELIPGRYYVARIGESNKKSRMIGDVDNGSGARKSNSSSPDISYSSSETSDDDSVESLWFCLNIDVCGPFPVDLETTEPLEL